MPSLLNQMGKKVLDGPSFWSAVVTTNNQIHVDLAQDEKEIHLTNIVLDTNSKYLKSCTLRAHTDHVRNGTIIAILRPGKTDNLNVNLTFFPSDKYLRLSIENIIVNTSNKPNEITDVHKSISMHISGKV
jgi:hypothetical protein